MAKATKKQILIHQGRTASAAPSATSVNNNNNTFLLHPKKSLSAHDCLSGVDDERLRFNSSSSSSSGLPPLPPAANKPRGWYATRKTYRSVAYKTWTVGSARNMLNYQSETDLAAVAASPQPPEVAPIDKQVSANHNGGYVSDSEELKYYSAQESDTEECSSATAPPIVTNGHKSMLVTNGHISPPVATNGHESPLAMTNGHRSLFMASSSPPMVSRSSAMVSCSDHEETDCYSSEDYCRFAQKRRSRPQQRRNGGSGHSSPLDIINGHSSRMDIVHSSSDDDCELRALLQTFADLHTTNAKVNGGQAPRGRLTFASGADALRYLKRELANIRQRDFVILQQLRLVEDQLTSNFRISDSPTCKDHLQDVSSKNGRLLMPVPKCLTNNNVA